MPDKGPDAMLDMLKFQTTYPKGVLGFGDRFSVPPGATIVPLSDVRKLQDRHLRKSGKTEYFFLKNGWALCGVSGILSGLVFNMHFRKLMHVGKTYLLASHGLAAFLPSYPIILSQKFLITEKLRVDPDGCQFCYANKSGILNAVFGAILPASMSIMSSVLISALNGYHDFPKFQLGNRYKFFKQYIQLSLTYAKGSVNLIAAGVVILYMVGLGIAYAESNDTQVLVQKLMTKFRPVDYVDLGKTKGESIEGGIREQRERLSDSKW